jgi:hypothetical protein
VEAEGHTAGKLHDRNRPTVDLASSHPSPSGASAARGTNIGSKVASPRGSWQSLRLPVLLSTWAMLLKVPPRPCSGSEPAVLVGESGAAVIDAWELGLQVVEIDACEGVAGVGHVEGPSRRRRSGRPPPTRS